MTEVTLDIVGCGAVARQFHLPSLQWLEAHGFVEVRYCLDPNRQAAEAIAARLHRARPFSAASPSDIDPAGAAIALVATPPEFHYEWACRYLQAGAGVLVEKPVVLTTHEFSGLMKVARAAERPVLVGHVRRLFPSAKAARDAVRAGVIGSIRRVEAYEGFRWSWMTRTDYPVRSRAGGVLYAFGPHALDTILYICGVDDRTIEDTKVDIVGIDRWPGSEPSHHFRADITLQIGSLDTPVALHLSRMEPLANLVRVQGETGDILVSTDYGRSALLRTAGSAKRLTAASDPGYATSLPGCFLAEHMEMWRVRTGADATSPLALDHFGLLTQVLEVLARGN